MSTTTKTPTASIPSTHLFYRLMASPNFKGEGNDVAGTPFSALEIKSSIGTLDIPSKVFITLLSALEEYSHFVPDEGSVAIRFKVAPRAAASNASSESDSTK